MTISAQNDGSFEFPYAVEGSSEWERVRVRAVHPRYALEFVEIVAGSTDVEIVMGDPAILEVRLVDEERKTLAGNGVVEPIEYPGKYRGRWNEEDD